MIAPAQQTVAQFLDDHVSELTSLCLGERPVPARAEVISRALSLVLARFLLKDAGLFWQDLTRMQSHPLYVVLEGLDTLEHGAFRLIRARADAIEVPTMIRTLEGMIDEVRAEHVRLLHVSDQRKQVLDVSVLEDIPEAVFILSLDLFLEPLNREARSLVADAPDLHCFRIFFGRTSPCTLCPLSRVIEAGEQVACPTVNGTVARLRPFTGKSAVAWLVDAPHSLRPREAGDSLGLGVLDYLGSGVLFVNADKEVLYANAFARELFGDQLLHSPIHSKLPSLRLAEDKQQHQLQVHLADGRHMLLGYRCVDCTLEGTTGTVVTFRDISDLERMRADMDQLKRLSEIGQMCAVVAHEIRNPLAGIKATIQSIEKEAAAAGLQTSIELIEREVDRLAELLSGFFAFVRQRPPRKRPTDLRAVASAAQRSAGPRLAGINLELHFDHLPQVWVDPDQMHQVLLNLLLNAADAVGKRGWICASGQVVGNELVLTVEDDGCGIPEADIERVFEAFYTTKSGGSGLGLSICYRIVSAHRGNIAVESAPGKGTLVEIRMPAFDRV